jgi:hypothetical protein
VVVFAIILIAACAISYRAGGQFDLKMAVLTGGAGLATLWALADAWRPRQGALHYAAGEWVLAQGEHESLGTLDVTLDLQQYLLVRFTPSGHAQDAAGLDAAQRHNIKKQWLHLESRHTRRHGQAQGAVQWQDWRALRRALFAVPVMQGTVTLQPKPTA